MVGVADGSNGVRGAGNRAIGESAGDCNRFIGTEDVRVNLPVYLVELLVGVLPLVV